MLGIYPSRVYWKCRLIIMLTLLESRLETHDVIYLYFDSRLLDWEMKAWLARYVPDPERIRRHDSNRIEFVTNNQNTVWKRIHINDTNLQDNSTKVVIVDMCSCEKFFMDTIVPCFSHHHKDA